MDANIKTIKFGWKLSSRLSRIKAQHHRVNEVKTNLKNFCRGALEEFNVASSYTLLVFCQRLGNVLITSEQHEGIPGSSTVSLMNEQYTLLTV